MPLADPAVDTYILQFPAEVQARLSAFRERIQSLVPDAEESMAYGMPAYKLHGKPLVYFAAFAKHIGFYTTPTGHAAFANELAAYKQGKGSVQFPLHEDMPWTLIEAIILFRKQENEQYQRK
ncbi:MAG: DUF1801 domain-containing protein [Sphingobacteriaceae bacterium]|nr:DUF1801 domain-containing protein [Sphingobacteriaceae bacterium]